MGGGAQGHGWRSRARSRWLGGALVLALVATSLSVVSVTTGSSPAGALSEITERVSLDADGNQVLGVNADADGPSISADGRFVAFFSYESFAPEDTNGAGDIYVRDRVNGTTELVSVTPGGTSGNETSGPASISADGRFVAFVSLAPDLVVGDANDFYDVFLRDRVAGTTQIVSVDASGVQAPYGHQMVSPVVSADGQHVAFLTDAQLDPADTDTALDVYVRDLDTESTRWVSVTPEGVGANGTSSGVSISADGRYVAFASNTTTLVPGVSGYQVYRWDRTSGDFVVVSVDESGNAVGGDSIRPSMSADGSRVVFQSDSATLVAGDGNGTSDVFLRDIVDGATVRVSAATSGEADGASSGAVISADGLWVAFFSQASNLIVDDTNDPFFGDVFQYHVTDGEIIRVSVGAGATQSNFMTSDLVSISADGTRIAFASRATNLVTPDANNSVSDVYVRDLAAADPPDGTAPSITLTNPVDGASYAQGSTVEAVYSCDDGSGSGVASCLGDVPNGSALDTSLPGVFTFTVNALDNAGNLSSTTASYEITAPDTTPPTITLVTPEDAAIYAQGSLVLADYSCGDTGGSGLASCGGDVASGTPIDTSALGNQSFSVVATDGAGNESSVTVSYLVMDVADTTAPELRELWLGAQQVDTTDADAVVEVTTRWFDPSPALAPPASATVTFRSPSGAASIPVNLIYMGGAGVGEHYMVGALVLPQGSEYGTWTVDGASATDGFGNTGTATALDVQLLGNSYHFDNQHATAPVDDYDGIPAAVEDAGPNGGDNNFDGVLDSWQPHVASFPNAQDGRYVTIASELGATLRGVSSVAAPPESSTVFPVGLLNYEVHGLPDGDTALVYVYLPLGQQAWSAEKDQGGEITPIPYFWGPDGFIMNGGAVVTLVLNDGGAFDADGSPNGVLVDPLRLSRPNSPPGLMLFQQPPGVDPNVFITNPDVPLTILVNAFDADGDPLEFSNTDPAHGTVTGGFTYTPDPGFVGDDSFIVYVSDPYVTTARVVNIRVMPPSLITCEDATIRMPANGSINLFPLGQAGAARCTTNDGLPVTLSFPYGVTHGTVAGNFSYIPHRNFVGQDVILNDVRTQSGGLAQLRTYVDVIGATTSASSGPAGSSFDVSMYCKGLATVAVTSPGPVVEASAAQTANGDVTFQLTLPTDVPTGDLTVTGVCDATYGGYGGYLGNGPYNGYNGYNGYSQRGNALPPVTFTVTAPPNDGDGVTEPPTYDGNGDGTADALQPDVTSVDSATGAGLVTIEAPDDTYSLQNVETSVPPSLPPGVSAPLGIISFDVDLPDGATTADVVLYLPEGITIDTVLKDLNGTIVDFTAHSTIDLPNRKVTLHLVDGGAGDADGVVNGVIRDPVILESSYSFRGFSAPVDASKVNVAKAGFIVPVTWRVLDRNGKPVSSPQSFVGITATPGSCGAARTDAIELYSPWDYGLKYLGNGYWTMSWKTSKSWAGSCRTMTLKLADGVGTRTAVFKFK